MQTGNIIIPISHKNQVREDEKFYIPITFYTNNGNIWGKPLSENRDSKRLQKLSLKKNTSCGTIHYDLQLDMKLDYTISWIFQEVSLLELQTFFRLSELKRTQIFESLALAVLKIPYAYTFYPIAAQQLMTRNKTYFGITLAPKSLNNV